jgi:hypothetical protein
MAKVQMLVVRPTINYRLERQCIESIDKNPHSYDSRQIKTGAQNIVLYLFIAVFKGAEHDNDGYDSKEQEDISN